MRVLLMVVIIMMLFSTSCQAFFLRSVKTTKIYDEDFITAELSPDKERLFIITNSDEIVLFDVKKGEIITRYPMITEEYVIYGHSVGWTVNNKIMLTKHHQDEKRRIIKRYSTHDLKRFEMLFQYDDNREKFLSKTNKKAIVLDTRTNEIKIKYSDGLQWNTGLSFKITGSSWSSDDRYVFLDCNKQTYLVDVEKQKIDEIDKFFSGRWAPTKNLLCFESETFSRGVFEEEGIYIFNADNLNFTRFNTNLKPISQTLSWSPDSKYILAINIGKMNLLDANIPSNPPINLVDLDGVIEQGRIFWSQDLKHILFSYRTRTINIFKPRNFYVARINIKNGKMRKLYIDGLLYKEFFWIDDNTIIYRVDHDNGLYKSELRW